MACNAADDSKSGFAIFVDADSTCYKNIHPQDLNVYFVRDKAIDFIGTSGSLSWSTLTMAYWETARSNATEYEYFGRTGDIVKLEDLMERLGIYADNGGKDRTWAPTGAPSDSPSASPSESSMPSEAPSSLPSIYSDAPSVSSNPSGSPSESVAPSEANGKSRIPSTEPSSEPSSSNSPSLEPSNEPSSEPSSSNNPSSGPTESISPSEYTGQPSNSPSTSSQPSFSPSVSVHPSGIPSEQPSSLPSFSTVSAETFYVHTTLFSSNLIYSDPYRNLCVQVPSSVPTTTSEPSSEPSQISQIARTVNDNVFDLIANDPDITYIILETQLDQKSGGVLVCGSEGEIASDSTEDDYFE